MSATGQQFRGAAIGGFNRQDVMRYIEAVARENTARISAMEQELVETKEKNTALTRELATFRAESPGRKEALNRLSGEVEVKSTALSQKTAALAHAERELACLREKVQQMEDATAAYENLKELAGTIELDARNRAQTMIQNAEAAAQKTREELEQWMEQVQTDYLRLRQDVDAMLTHAGSEMERAKKTVDNLIGGFAEQDATLRHMIEMYQRAMCTVQNPAPADFEKEEVGVR